MNNVKSLKEIVKQLRICGYTCEAGPLENNVDFRMLERIAGYVSAEHEFGEGERTLLDDLMKDAREAGEIIGNALCNLGKLAVRSPQEIRDDIIEQAKRDVAELLVDGCAFVTTGGHFTGYKALCEPEFIVNHEKRTVVVLMRGFRSKSVRTRGIAKCAPDDCFNVHLGKAIALRRALGLEVPVEYLSAPQPTEVRNYDIIRLPNGELRTITPGNHYDRRIKMRQCQADSLNATKGRIIDDSREEDV